MKRLNDSSDAPEARRGILPKTIYKLKEKDKAAFYFPAEGRVPAASTKRVGGKRVCGGFGRWYAYGQQARL